MGLPMALWELVRPFKSVFSSPAGCATILLIRPKWPNGEPGLIADDSTMKRLALGCMVPVEVRDSAGSLHTYCVVLVWN